jgi:hypothetical protein
MTNAPLTDPFDRALLYATHVHGGQTRNAPFPGSKIAAPCRPVDDGRPLMPIWDSAGYIGHTVRPA